MALDKQYDDEWGDVQRQIADHLYEYLIDEAFQEITLSEFLKDFEDAELTGPAAEALGYDQDSDGGWMKITRADIEQAYRELGYNFADDRMLAQQRECEKKWLRKVDACKMGLHDCGDKPEYAQAKEHYRKQLEEAEANLAAVRSGILI